jgi:hypothetical protein
VRAIREAIAARRMFTAKSLTIERMGQSFGMK